jgi:hypothetical protein
MRRLPRRRGFTNPFRVEFQPVNLRDLDRFDDGAEVTPETLKDVGVVSTLRAPVKVLGSGDITKKLKVTAHKFSASARQKIEAAGGTATALIPDRPETPENGKKAKRKAKAKGQSPVVNEAPEAAEKSEQEAGQREEATESEDNGDSD